ncbi:MAG: CocE/NonD family hydrolase, partial [Jatrophihabitantaceae bacterium]
MSEQSSGTGEFASSAAGGEVPSRLAHLVGDFGPIHPGAEPQMVGMRDGVRLATDVYLPQPLRGRAPAVLLRTCYDKCGPLMSLPATATVLAAAGYVAVVQDVRGRFRSEGERLPFFHELADGYDTLNWIERQPWSNGIVGMLGTSYLGFAQWAAAAGGHPALRALSLAVTSQLVPTTWWGPRLAAPAGTEWLVDEWSCPTRLEGRALDWTQRPFADVVPADLPNARALLGLMRRLGGDPAALQARAFP